MIIPVRCFTCGKVVGSSFPAFIERTRGGEEPRKVLDELGLKRYCCRRMILSHAELIDEELPFGCRFSTRGDEPAGMGFLVFSHSRGFCGAVGKDGIGA